MTEEGLTEDPTPTYRSLSTVAVAGLLLGLISTVAFILPTLWPLAVVGAVVSWAAARSVARSPETKAGMGLALVGLAVSIATAAATYARGVTAARLHQAAAGAVAEEFLRRLGEDDFTGALELTLPHDARAANREAAELYYASNDEAEGKLETFVEDPAIVALAGSTGPELVDRSAASRKRFGKLQLSLLYAVTGQPSPRVALTLERSSPRAGGATAWRVESYRLSD